MLVRLIAVGAAGAAGTLLRWGLQSGLQGGASRYPAGTLAVNLLGCLLYGIVWSLAETRELISPMLRLVLLTGFMGAFTTFSTFMFETNQMTRQGDWAVLVLYAGAQLMLGFVVLGLGIWIGRTV